MRTLKTLSVIMLILGLCLPQKGFCRFGETGEETAIEMVERRTVPSTSHQEKESSRREPYLSMLVLFILFLTNGRCCGLRRFVASN